MGNDEIITRGTTKQYVETKMRCGLRWIKQQIIGVGGSVFGIKREI
jgi:hypothetical protein